MSRLLPSRHRLWLTVSTPILTAVLAAITACSTSQPPSTVTVTQPSTSTVPANSSLVDGHDIFLTGIDASGVRVNAQGFAMMTRGFACADCHGTQGKGGTVYMMMAQHDVPNITWPALTGADYTPPYTVDTLKQAITQGLDQQGQALDPFMPRWSMSSQDLSDLVSYLQTLK